MRDKLVRLAADLKLQNPPARVEVLIPKAHAGAGSICALLGQKTQAREWLERSIQDFRRLQNAPDFPSRADLKEAEEALAKLR